MDTLCNAGYTPPMPASYRAVLFDFDGTLTLPGALDFEGLRTALGCAAGTPIIEFIAALPSEEERSRAHRILDGFEEAAARSSFPNVGAEELVRRLAERGLGKAILTRNTMASIRQALKNFTTLSESDFTAILTRESEGRPKPHPDGVLNAARLLGVKPAEMLVVGDFVYDIAAGKAAGAPTVLVTNGEPAPDYDPAPDFTISALADLLSLL
jgi:HAD superfamily hydrolase (TIGR01509 family)